ncbi:MAG: hypothetical protein LBM38_04705 [Clostridiales bacterium]|jgi:hypothetical protein|nr:hypothetical protein [Clostridiales bacterium]
METCGPGPVTNAHKIKEAVCIHTDKVYDSCKDKDCLEDLQVILTRCDQDIVNSAINVKAKSAEVIWVFTEIEPLPFNRGYFSVDVKYFFNVTLEVFTGVGRPTLVNGLATFDKKVVLFGSEGNSKIYSSKYNNDEALPTSWRKNNLPQAIVEVVDPICLSAKLVEDDECDCCCGCCCGCGCDLASIPQNVCNCFEGDLAAATDNSRHVLVSLGLFSIIKIERNVQLLIPAYDFCVPQKECLAATDENPCDLFNRLRFPMDEFFPPMADEFEQLGGATTNTCGCGCR